MTKPNDIDILENSLRSNGEILNLLLFDRTTRKNILWCTDSYKIYGRGFDPKDFIKPELITKKYGRLIQPRAAKSLIEQRERTKDKAEVFTPLKIVGKINKEIDRVSKNGVPDKTNWQSYIRELKLEIACGEGPFIASRYNPTAHTGKLIKIVNRVGFLDHKLRVVSKYCEKHKEWILWAKEAYRASYGYEWQGDNILIARENLLYTLIDFYKAKFGRRPSLGVQQEFAEIISWNIFQMDGIKFTIPMSCKSMYKIPDIAKGQLGLQLADTPRKIKVECEGCRLGYPFSHTGKYVKVMDWELNKPIRFIDILSGIK